MSTIRERAPIHPTTDQLLDELRQTLARAEALWTDLAALLANGPAATTDPLAGFRTPAGTVCYRTVPVADVKPGQWFERQHGDEHWYQVESIVHGESAIGLAHGRGGLMWFPRVDGRVRVACRPELLACRAESAELRAEARAES